MNTLGNRLRELRESRRMTQTDLSKLLGMKTYTTVSKWESGENLPRGKDLKFLSEYFGVSSDYLLGLKDYTENDIAVIYNQLDLSRKAKVYSFAETQLREQNNVIHADFGAEKDKDELLEYPMLGSASAGIGEYLGEEHKETILIPYSIIPENADFCLKVNGNSMQTLFEDGDYIFVDRDAELRNGIFGVMIVNGDAYVKKIYIENDKMRLVSINTDYEDIVISHNDNYKFVGKVVL